MTDSPPIFLITGPPGAGKTSIATRLMQRFPFGLHIPVDDLREWVVSGLAPPLPEWTSETSRQFCLARQAAANVAHLYLEAGFAVAIDDIITPDEGQALFAGALPGYRLYRILLRPRVEIAIARNASRKNKRFDTSILAEPIRSIHRWLGEQNFAAAGWIVIDSSGLGVDETV